MRLNKVFKFDGALEGHKLVAPEQLDELKLSWDKEFRAPCVGFKSTHDPLTHRGRDIDLLLGALRDVSLNDHSGFAPQRFSGVLAFILHSSGVLSELPRGNPKVNALARVRLAQVGREYFERLGVVHDRLDVALPSRYLELDVGQCLGFVYEELFERILGYGQQRRIANRGTRSGPLRVFIYKRDLSKV